MSRPAHSPITDCALTRDDAPSGAKLNRYFFCVTTHDLDLSLQSGHCNRASQCQGWIVDS
jgi:hypothetical protein